MLETPTNTAGNAESKQKLSYGQKAVGLTFNPSQDPKVKAIKENCANVIDHLHMLREFTENGEAKAQFTIAIRAIMDGQMWWVKAATWELNN